MKSGEEPQIKVIDGWDGLEVIDATYERPRFTRHAHATYAFGVVLRGTNRFYYRGAEHWAPAGAICTVTPEEAHEVEPGDGGFSYRCFYPSAALMARIAESVEGRRVSRTFLLAAVADDAESAQLVNNAFEACVGCSSALARDEALLMLLQRIVIRHASQPVAQRGARTPRRAVVMARDYLAAHCCENVTLRSLGGVTGMDSFMLVRAFARAYGLPPHAWLIQERVRRAQSLLRDGLAPAEVAGMLGFSDQSHLTRCFKRIVGVTPARYRAASEG